MNLAQFERHDGDGDVFINPAHVAMVEPRTVGDDNVTARRGRRPGRARPRSRPRAHQGRRRQAAPRDARQHQHKPQGAEDSQDLC